MVEESLPAPPSLTWGHAFGGPPAHGLIRVEPEDFFVDEQLGFAPSGSGEHVLLRIEKRSANSEWVAGQIATLAGVPRRDVGFAGRKDRHAVARQWFSVGLAGRPEPDWSQLEKSGIVLLEAARHGRKLRRGALSGNRFQIRVRDVDGDLQLLEERLGALVERGVPNLFGLQRFGRGGGNLVGASRLLGGERLRVDRNRRGMFFSAARSWLFNAVLDRRLADGSWERALDGDALVLDGRRSFFVADRIDEEIARRVAALEIHPSGPLYGRGDPSTLDAARQLEEEVLAPHSTWCEGLVRCGLDADRRKLRVRAVDLAWQQTGETWELAFALPAGSFATALLRELFSGPGL